MHELTLNELKKIELNIAIYIDDFCRKNNIEYSLGGGSLLGAVRHKGFIPWDDDIDLNMTRDQYERFSLLFQEETGPYRLITYKNDPQYKYLFAKVVDTRTQLIEDHNFPVDDMGVFVDIFPIDSLGDTETVAIANLKKVKFKRFLCVAACWKHFYINRNRSLLRQLPRLVFFVLSRFIDVKKINAWIENQFPFNMEKKYWGCVCGSYEEREVMEQKVFTEYMDIEFEGHSLRGIRNYDMYLSNLYGNYMKLPPKNKQVAHHTFIAYEKAN